MKKALSLLLAFILTLSTLPIISANANIDEETNYQMFGDATLLNDNSIELTPLDTWKVGGVWFKNKLDAYNGIQVEFSYWAGGGRDNSYGGADGLVLLFSNNTYNLGEAGGALGFVNDSALGIEFDSYPHNSGDPAQKHIAVVRDIASNHLKSVYDNRVDDSKWHNVIVTIKNGNVSVMLDGEEVLIYSGVDFLLSELYVGFAASTGSGLNRHMIKDVIVRNHDTYESLITRVKQYTYSSYSIDTLNLLANDLDLSIPANYEFFSNTLNDIKNSRKEHNDFIYLTNNSLYLSYHLKNELSSTKDRIVLGLGGLVFSGEAVGALVGEWPEKDKYKTALKQYMKATCNDYETLNYISDTVDILEVIAEKIADPLEKSKINELISTVGKANSAGHVKTLLYEFNFDFDKHLKEVVKYNNNRLAKAFGYAGDTISLIDITAEGIANLMSVSSNLDIYKNYEDFLTEIQSETSFPVALRVAANELNQDITAQYLEAILDIEQELGKFVIDKGISLGATQLGSAAVSATIGSILAGISIGTIIGNLLFGVDDYLKACAYIECYARLGEYYSTKLQADRCSFLNDESMENAKNFRDDYIILWNLRFIGEKTFKDMIGFEKHWSKTMKHILRSIKGYYENKAFLERAISDLNYRKFSMVNDLPYGELSFKGQYSREIYFACPVDLYIYDNSTDTLIGSIINSSVENNDESSLPLVLYTEGESNHILIPENADYRIEVLATDNGSMSVSNDLINNNLDIIQKVNYFNVELKEGKYHIINPDDLSEVDYDNMYFDNGYNLQIIQPNEIILSSELTNNTINVKVETTDGGLVYGDGEYNKGDYVCLNAISSTGHVFDGWYINSTCISNNQEYGFIATGNVSIKAVFETSNNYNSTIKINNNNGSKTINYGETLKLTAIATDKPADAKIYWYVDGVKKGEGETFNVSFESGTKTVEVKLVDSNGNVIKNVSGNEISDSEEVTVKSGFFQKIISFFKNLFRMNRTVVQAFKGVF